MYEIVGERVSCSERERERKRERERETRRWKVIFTRLTKDKVDQKSFCFES